MISTSVVSSSKTVIIMVHSVLHHVGYVSGCILLIVYRKEVCILLSCVCFIGFMWITFKAYKMVSFFLTCMQSCGYSTIPSYTFDYPPDIKSCQKNNPQSSKKQFIGNAVFDGLDTFAKCLKVEFK